MRASTSPQEALSRGVALAFLCHCRSRTGASESRDGGDPGRLADMTPLPRACRDRALGLVLKHVDHSALLRALRSSLEVSISDEPVLSPEGKALLSPRAPSKALGSEWIRAAAPPRHGYTSSTDLLAILASLATRPRSFEVAEREARIGRALDDDAGALSSDPDSSDLRALRAKWESIDEVVRARLRRMAGASRLDGEARLAVPSPASEQSGAPRVLGAIFLGYLGDRDGDIDSAPLRTSGAELRELVEAGCLV